MYENIVLWRFGVIQVIRVTLPLQGCRFALPSTILRVALMEVWTVGGTTGMSSLTWLSSSGFTANRQHNNVLVKYFVFFVFLSGWVFSTWCTGVAVLLELVATVTATAVGAAAVGARVLAQLACCNTLLLLHCVGSVICGTHGKGLFREFTVKN